jgi:hypothetical protein
MKLERQSCVASAVRFVGESWIGIGAVSAALLIPCFWHKRIEAGDLGSHVYNAWLAQLISRGHAPGLYLARQWNNVLFDWLLLHLANALSLAAAQKIAVSLCVLVFFWGAFSLISAVSGRPPWALLPCLFMLAYGWTFNVGFFNYYLSLGLGFFATAIVWRSLGVAASETGAGGTAIVDILLLAIFAVLVLIAHPQGFVWLAGSTAYIWLRTRLPGWWKLVVPACAVVAVIVARIYLMRHYESFGIWNTFGAGIYNGSDQIALYSSRYYFLSGAAVLLGIGWFAGDRLTHGEGKRPWKDVQLPFELHWFVVFSVYVLPDAVRVPLYAGWVGALGVRLTTVAAAVGLCVLGLLRPRIWHSVGFAAVAAIFFLFLYRHTATLNRMEAQIEHLVATIPHGERVTATIWAPPDSRLPYIHHLMDRGCVGRCFSYQNYEPASRQFRVRVEEGSPIATSDPDLSQEMEAGEYVVQPEDLPMAQIYQCNEQDLTQLCVRQLGAGEANGRLGYHPPREE